MFRPSAWSRSPTMPSADFSTSFPSPRGDSSTQADVETSPGNAHSPSRLCLPHIRPCFPCKYWALKIYAFSPSMPASYVISVRQASALPAASFRFYLAVDTLAVRLTVPLTGSVGDLTSAALSRCLTPKWVHPAGRTSSRRRAHALRPLTPPYVRFRIRRFMKYLEVYAVRLTGSRVPCDQSISLGTPRSCVPLPNSTTLPGH